MTKKDYIVIAEAFRRERPSRSSADAYRVWEAMEIRLAGIMEQDNPRFDHKRFYAACEE